MDPLNGLFMGCPDIVISYSLEYCPECGPIKLQWLHHDNAGPFIHAGSASCFEYQLLLTASESSDMWLPGWLSQFCVSCQLRHTT